MSQLLTTYLRDLKKIGLERKIPNITEENAEFIKALIRMRKPEHILEIGTANGYSTLQFASVFLEESLTSSTHGSNISSIQHSIITIEYAYNAHIEAVEHFKNCKVKNIHAIWGDAKDVLPTLREGYFDFVYIDAMKREYLDYLLLSLPLMTPDAIIVIDDVEKFRDKMENLYTWLEKSKITYRTEKTDHDDSIMILSRSDIR